MGRHHTRADHHRASAAARTARRLANLPLAAAALAEGPITWEHAHALTAAATPRRFAHIAEHEQTLVALARAATPRRWAAALWTNGWRAVRHRLRGDITQQLAGRALFGASGRHARAPAGMSSSIDVLDRGAAGQLLAELNVEVRPIPAHVPIIPPPTPPELSWVELKDCGGPCQHGRRLGLRAAIRLATEYVVPVEWIRTRKAADAVSEPHYSPDR
ncbi:MAG: hypothetical protein ACR2MA_01445 [Egibacteraceae bacterium]